MNLLIIEIEEVEEEEMPGSNIIIDPPYSTWREERGVTLPLTPLVCGSYVFWSLFRF